MVIMPQQDPEDCNQHNTPSMLVCSAEGLAYNLKAQEVSQTVSGELAMAGLCARLGGPQSHQGTLNTIQVLHKKGAHRCTTPV